MNKYIIFFLVISLFSCERKKTSVKDQVQIVFPKVKEAVSTEKEKVVITEIEKVEKTDEENTKINLSEESESVQVLPKRVLFGELKVDITEEDEKIQITSTDEFAENLNFSLKGKTDAFIETDVDGNGFNEFYIVTNTGDLAAFSSYNNKSFGQINVAKKPFAFYEDCTKVKFWEAKNKKLSITFENGAGELNTVRYKLKMGEASYQLVAE
ncbi:MAG: virulence-associated protein VagC [Planctomycetota bacterium]|jgi:virulence-associated protein VagC